MNRSVLFWLLLVVDGVFADDVKSVSVSVLVGDSVTLNTDDTETQGAEALRWKIQDEKQFIAEIDKEAGKKPEVPGNNEERFKGRLELDDQTGSLTITNLTTTDSRVYELHIKKKESKITRFSVTVRDVVESVSVMEGDSVTLHTGVKLKGDDQILWKFGDQGTIIARLNGPVDKNNIHLNNQTGDLTIRNIRSYQNGVYKVEINTSGMILHRKYCINIDDELKTVSVKVGDFVILRTGLTEILGYDLTWKSQDHLMAEINRTAHQSSLYGSANGTSEDRLQLHPQTGSLIISDIKTTDSGDYYLTMSSSSHTIQRTIRVTVKESGLSPAAVAGIAAAAVVVVVVVILVAAGVTLYHRRR